MFQRRPLYPLQTDGNKTYGLIFPRLLQLVYIDVLQRVLRALQPVIGRPDGMEAAPVPFTQDPGQHVHFVVQLGRELGADEVGRSGSFPPCDQLHVIVVATVLSRQRGAVERKHGAHAEPRRRLVDVQALFRAAGIPPPVGLAELLVEDVDGTVDRLGRVDAGAAG